VPLEAVSRTLGHADPSITLRVYNKAFRGRERMAAEALDAAFGKSTGVKTGVTAAKSSKERKPTNKKKAR
jgi:hypothetical protein